MFAQHDEQDSRACHQQSRLERRWCLHRCPLLLLSDALAVVADMLFLWRASLQPM